MTKKIYGDLEVSGNVTTGGSNTVRDINGFLADSTGDIAQFYYNKQYIDQMVSVLPISRVGSMDYLPLNINGSFEGATTSSDKKIMPVLIEDDGTLVYLRPGTNGSTQGYYYCYQRDARNVSTTFSPVLTNSKYVPTYFDSNHSINSFVGSKADEVLFMNTISSGVAKYAIALTNGTLNSVSHQYVEFATTLIAGFPQYAHLVGSTVYIWCLDSLNDVDPFSVSLYTILASDIVAGVTTSLAKVTGISGKNLYGDTISASNFVSLTPKLTSTTSTDKPFCLYDPSVTMDMYHLYKDGIIQAAEDSTNSNIRVALFCPFVAITVSGISPPTMWGFSFTYNISTKAYTFDTTSLAPITATSISNITNPFQRLMENINGFPTGAQGNCPTILQTNDGVVFSTVSRYITSPVHYVTKGTIANFVDLYSSLNLTSRALSTPIISAVNPFYGSPLGENLINPRLLSSTKIMLSCAGTENGIYNGFNSTAYTDIGSTQSYVYNSAVTGGTINGYAPQTNRHFITNTNYQYNGTITLVAADGTVRTYGSSFIEGVTKPANNLLNASTLAYDGTVYTLSNANLLTNLKTSILGAVSGYTGTITNSKIVLYYVPDGTFSKSIACVSFYTSTNNSYIVVSEVTVTIAGTVISALTSTSNRLIQSNSGIIIVDTTYLERMAGLVIAKYSDFTYIGVPALFNMGTSGNTTFRSAVGKIDNSTQLITGNLVHVPTQYLSIGGGSFEIGVLPNVGFGLYENGSITDYQTKLVFKNFGTTSAQMTTMLADITASPVSRLVVAAQDVAQGFNVYFTQDVPVLISGQYKILKSTSIDLSTVDSSPASKTFYVYVILNEGIVSYKLSTTQLTEELYRIYIGTIVTGASGINSIVSEKVTRFLTYRPSTTNRGSAIPTSTGVPSSTGTRWTS